MTKAEKVIKGLESIHAVALDKEQLYVNHISMKDFNELLADALELLKEREARVIDISEIYTAKKLDVWFEDKGDNIVHPLMLIETEMTNKSQTAFFFPMMVRPIKAYGKTWRCWTARPTDEQRDATPWNEPPKEERE